MLEEAITRVGECPVGERNGSASHG